MPLDRRLRVLRRRPTHAVGCGVVHARLCKVDAHAARLRVVRHGRCRRGRGRLLERPLPCRLVRLLLAPDLQCAALRLGGGDAVPPLSLLVRRLPLRLGHRVHLLHRVLLTQLPAPVAREPLLHACLGLLAQLALSLARGGVRAAEAADRA
eukprot:4668882-Prymnesium_polylepis.1